MILYFFKLDIWSDFWFLYLFKGTNCNHLIFNLTLELVYILQVIFVYVFILIDLALVFRSDIFKLNHLLLSIHLNIIHLLLLNSLKGIILIYKLHLANIFRQLWVKYLFLEAVILANISLLHIKLIICFILLQDNIILIPSEFGSLLTRLPHLLLETEILSLILILSRIENVSIILIELNILLEVDVLILKLIILLDELYTLVDFGWLKFELMIVITLSALTVSLFF